jgi:hypothetical protein
MNLNRLMTFVPAGVVLAAAFFLGLSHERLAHLNRDGLFVGFGAVIALMVLANYDYSAKRRIHSAR